MVKNKIIVFIGSVIITFVVMHAVT